MCVYVCVRVCVCACVCASVRVFGGWLRVCASVRICAKAHWHGLVWRAEDLPYFSGYYFFSLHMLMVGLLLRLMKAVLVEC